MSKKNATDRAVDLALARVLEICSTLTPDQQAELESRVWRLGLFHGIGEEMWDKVKALAKKLEAMGGEQVETGNRILEVSRGSLQLKLDFVDFTRNKLRRRKPNDELDRKIVDWRDVEGKTFSQVAKEIAKVTGKKCNYDAAWKRYRRATKRLG
jgi:hypothetical protein